jgi:hypothetical protein
MSFKKGDEPLMTDVDYLNVGAKKELNVTLETK